MRLHLTLSASAQIDVALLAQLDQSRVAVGHQVLLGAPQVQHSKLIVNFCDVLRDEVDLFAHLSTLLVAFFRAIGQTFL